MQIAKLRIIKPSNLLAVLIEYFFDNLIPDFPYKQQSNLLTIFISHNQQVLPPMKLNRCQITNNPTALLYCCGLLENRNSPTNGGISKRKTVGI